MSRRNSQDDLAAAQQGVGGHGVDLENGTSSSVPLRFQTVPDGGGVGEVASGLDGAEQSDEEEEDAALIQAQGVLAQNELLGLFSALNEAPDLSKNQPGIGAKISARVNSLVSDFIRGAWGITTFGLMAKYDPTGWLQFFSGASDIIVYSGVGAGILNAILGQLKDAYSPAKDTPTFIAQLRELNTRALQEGLALNRLLSEDWTSLLPAEQEMLPSALATVHTRLSIHSAEEYLRDSSPDSTMQAIYDFTQHILSMINYPVSGTLIAKAATDFFKQSIDPVNGPTWLQGVAVGYEAALVLTGTMLSLARAHAVKRNLIARNEEVAQLIWNIENLAEKNRALYEELRGKFNLPPTASRSHTSYGSVSRGKPAIEDLVGEMHARVQTITNAARDRHGLFAASSQQDGASAALRRSPGAGGSR